MVGTILLREPERAPREAITWHEVPAARAGRFWLLQCCDARSLPPPRLQILLLFQ